LDKDCLDELEFYCNPKDFSFVKKGAEFGLTNKKVIYSFLWGSLGSHPELGESFKGMVYKISETKEPENKSEIWIPPASALWDEKVQEKILSKFVGYSIVPNNYRSGRPYDAIVSDLSDSKNECFPESFLEFFKSAAQRTNELSKEEQEEKRALSLVAIRGAVLDASRVRLRGLEMRPIALRLLSALEGLQSPLGAREVAQRWGNLACSYGEAVEILESLGIFRKMKNGNMRFDIPKIYRTTLKIGLAGAL